MKTLEINDLEVLEGGWHSWKQHLGCALIGASLGGGIGSAALYVGCLLTLEEKSFL